MFDVACFKQVYCDVIHIERCCNVIDYDVINCMMSHLLCLLNNAKFMKNESGKYSRVDRKLYIKPNWGLVRACSNRRRRGV